MYNNAGDLDLEVAELLVCSGFLMPHELDKAFAYRRQTGERLRDVLMFERAIEENIWNSAHSVIEQINQKRIPRESGRTALYMIGNCRMSVNECISKMGIGQSPTGGNPWLKQLGFLAESNKWETGIN